jgi:hypothetical protein
MTSGIIFLSSGKHTLTRLWPESLLACMLPMHNTSYMWKSSMCSFASSVEPYGVQSV